MVESVYVPFALNCWFVPRGMVGVIGERAIEINAAGLIVNVATPEIEPDVALIVVEPTLSDCAKPAVGGDTLMIATVGSDDVHWAELVRSCIVPSVKMPVALYCCVVPSGIVANDGVTETLARTAFPTVAEPVPTAEPS